MAVAFVAGQVTSGFQFNASITLTLGACTAGNIVVLTLQAKSQATDPAPGWPAGFTQFIAGAGGGANNNWYYAAWKQMSGGETSFLVTVSVGQLEATASEWSGVDTTNPIDVVGTVNNLGFVGSGAKSFNAITTVNDNAMVVAITVNEGGATWSDHPPAGYTSILAGGAGGWDWLSYKLEATHGLVTPGNQTLSANDIALLHTFALKPTITAPLVTIGTSLSKVTAVINVQEPYTTNSPRLNAYFEHFWGGRA